MSDSLLASALTETRRILTGLEPEAKARSLGTRLSVLEGAAAMLELQSASANQVIQLVKLALDARDEAVALKQVHAVRGVIAEFMD